MERSGLLKDITTLFANEKIKVTSMKSRVDYRNQLSIMDFDLEVTNVEVSSRRLQARGADKRRHVSEESRLVGFRI